MDPVKEKEIEDEYLSSLMDLNVNSKPLINMLTMLAEENIEYAPVIVRAVEKHLAKVSSDVKLPIMYLIDSIVKNVGDKYKQLFAQNIVNMFCGVFEKVNEKVREKMYSLRITWNEVFPQTKLYALDVKVNVMDNNWPITAKVLPKSVHVNPNFLKKPAQNAPPPAADADKEDILKQMQAKERELLELQKRKIELEVMAYKKKIAEQEKEIQGNQTIPVSGIMIPPASHSMMTHVPMSHPPHGHGRMRIAPVNAAMLNSARSRDPRLIRMKQQPTATTTSAAPMHQHQNSNQVLSMSNITKSMPRIPKFSSKPSRDHHERDSRDRDPRNRRNRDRDDSNGFKSNIKNMSSSKDKNKTTSSSSKSVLDGRKKSGSSDESSKSPRKRNEKIASSHHKASSNLKVRSSKSPSKGSSINDNTNSGQSKDVDLRILPGSEQDMKPDSTTSINASKASKDKLLNKLLNGEDVKSSHDDEMITSDNEDTQTEKSSKQDTDLRFAEGTKKRSLDNGPEDSEPSSKKNRSDGDLLFGNEDVDQRSQQMENVVEKKSKTKDKADFEAVRAKLNATKEKNRLRGIKLLDEVPKMPPSENGTTEMVRKILNRKDKVVKIETKEGNASPHEIEEPTEIVLKKKSRFTDPLDEKNEVADMGNMTAAELRQTSMGPGALRKEKRKESKWNQPNAPLPIQQNMGRQFMPPHMMIPQQFVNPWESNPMIQAMRNQTQMPLVVQQSPSLPILNNKMRTLRLDGTRDHLLRFYNETAIIFSESGEPNDIKFSSGQSTVIIDDTYKVVLEFNDTYKSIVIEGKMHQIKFGTPTRELYIDDHFYECYFNNQPTQIVLNEKLRLVRIEGKAPEVKIGRKRSDLVLGLINVLIDAEIMVPVFLDTTVQYFECKGKVFTLQFADFFMSVVINNEPFKVEFGGMPKNYVLNGEKHFLRFTDLPNDVVPGRVNLRGMRRTHLFRNCKTPPLIEDNYIENKPAFSLLPKNSNEQHLDISKMVENDMKIQPQMELPPLSNTGAHDVIPGIGADLQGASVLGLPNLNISELFQKLVATGILSNNNLQSESMITSAPQQELTVENKSDTRSDDKKSNKSTLSYIDERRKISLVSLARADTIKKRQQAIVDTLYCGIQCSSCGLRFPPEQTMKYSQHLDWHFRQNRRERDSQRRAHSRKWYYNQSDWIKYEEIEDLEEREKNFFETQQMELMDQGDDSNPARVGGNQENTLTISCPAGPDDVNRCCDMCHDQFEQFFNEETEEWHLRSAIKIDDRFFHPICYEDYKISLTLDESALTDTIVDNTKVEEDGDVEMIDNKNIVVKEEKPNLVQLKSETALAEDDDDDVIVLPTEEPIVTEIPDEPEAIGENAEKTIGTQLSVTDDDVMIQEPKIETQLVEDDDDDDYQPNANDENSLLDLNVKIKEEPTDDGYEDFINEEDAFVEVTAIANDDLMQDENYTNSPKSAFQPAQDENAMFDEPSLMLQSSNMSPFDENSHGLDDEGSRPESNGGTPTAVIGGNKRLKIVLSSLAQTNLSNKNLNSNIIDPNDNSNNVEPTNKSDLNMVEITNDSGEHQPNEEFSNQDESEMEFTIKPQLQDVKLERNPIPVRRGYENSGLCSIM